MKDPTLKELKLLEQKRKKDIEQLKYKRKKQKPTLLKEVIENFFRKDDEVQHEITTQRALLAWPKYVGDVVANISKPVALKNNILYVKVPDALWKAQLLFSKTSLLDRYKKDFPKLNIRNIYFIS